jgi:hypothetical protein
MLKPQYSAQNAMEMAALMEVNQPHVRSVMDAVKLNKLLDLSLVK